MANLGDAANVWLYWPSSQASNSNPLHIYFKSNISPIYSKTKKMESVLPFSDIPGTLTGEEGTGLKPRRLPFPLPGVTGHGSIRTFSLLKAMGFLTIQPEKKPIPKELPIYMMLLTKWDCLQMQGAEKGCPLLNGRCC